MPAKPGCRHFAAEGAFQLPALRPDLQLQIVLQLFWHMHFWRPWNSQSRLSLQSCLQTLVLYRSGNRMRTFSLRRLLSASPSSRPPAAIGAEPSPILDSGNWLTAAEPSFANCALTADCGTEVKVRGLESDEPSVNAHVCVWQILDGCNIYV